MEFSTIEAVSRYESEENALRAPVGLVMVIFFRGGFLQE